jgi:hypothetical protein
MINVKREQRFADAIGFTEQDLAANREGYMTKSQRALLDRERKLWRSDMQIAMASLPIAVVLTIWDGYRIGDTLSSRIGILIFFTVIIGLWYVDVRRRWRWFDGDLYKGEVVFTDGKVGLRTYRQKNGRIYLVKVSKLQFSVQKQAYHAFREGDPYRIYYAPRSKRLLSAEWLRE